jgi:Flp pilus assembly protein TadD
MIREQLRLLLTLYCQPVQGASRIIDEGRFWFALCAAALALALLQAGAFLDAGPGALLTAAPSRHAYSEGKTVRQAIPDKNATPESRAEDGDDDGDVSIAARSERYLPFVDPVAGLSPFGLISAAILIGALQPAMILKILGAMALAFVPAAILVMTLYRCHESFAVMLRKDYISLLNCVLMSLAASCLPVAIVRLLLHSLQLGIVPLLILFAASQVYFLILAGVSIRTVWGSGSAVAAGASAVGWAAALAGLTAFAIFGSVTYYFSSPFFLYYAYAFVGSDVRSLGDGFRSRQHLRRQLDIATTNPRDADAHYQLGLIYQQRRQFDEAKTRFLHAVEIDPKEADPLFQLGRIALNEERPEEAIDLLSKAATLDDKCASHEVWRELGIAYFRASQFEDARGALGKYAERRAYDPEGLYWLGKTLVVLSRLDEARQHFEMCREAVTTMPPHRRRQLGKWKRLADTELRDLEKTCVARS